MIYWMYYTTNNADSSSYASSESNASSTSSSGLTQSEQASASLYQDKYVTIQYASGSGYGAADSTTGPSSAPSSTVVVSTDSSSFSESIAVNDAGSSYFSANNVGSSSSSTSFSPLTQSTTATTYLSGYTTTSNSYEYDYTTSTTTNSISTSYYPTSTATTTASTTTSTTTSFATITSSTTYSNIAETYISNFTTCLTLVSTTAPPLYDPVQSVYVFVPENGEILYYTTPNMSLGSGEVSALLSASAPITISNSFVTLGAGNSASAAYVGQGFTTYTALSVVTSQTTTFSNSDGTFDGTTIIGSTGTMSSIAQNANTNIYQEESYSGVGTTYPFSDMQDGLSTVTVTTIAQSSSNTTVTLASSPTSAAVIGAGWATLASYYSTTVSTTRLGSLTAATIFNSTDGGHESTSGVTGYYTESTYLSTTASSVAYVGGSPTLNDSSSTATGFSNSAGASSVENATAEAGSTNSVIQFGMPLINTGFGNAFYQEQSPMLGWRLTPTDGPAAEIGLGTFIPPASFISWVRGEVVTNSDYSPFDQYGEFYANVSLAQSTPVSYTGIQQWQDSNSLSYSASMNGVTLSLTTASKVGSSSTVTGSLSLAWTTAGPITQTMANPVSQNWIEAASNVYASDSAYPNTLFLSPGIYIRNNSSTQSVTAWTTSTLASADHLRSVATYVYASAPVSENPIVYKGN